MKIYTKTGDGGETSLFGGRRVSKAHVRIEAYGLVDQLNAQLGVTRLHVADADLDGLLHRVQCELFSLGADLATPLDVRSDYIVRMSDDLALRLEAEMDEMDAELSPLTTFILPAGVAAAAYLHLARTICRTAERAVVLLAEHESITTAALTYLNRLSDWLFTLARYMNHRAETADVPWISPVNTRAAAADDKAQGGDNGESEAAA